MAAAETSVPTTLDIAIGLPAARAIRDGFRGMVNSGEHRERWLQRQAKSHGVSLECVARGMLRRYWDTYYRLCESCDGMFVETRPPSMKPVLHVCEQCAAVRWSAVLMALKEAA